MRIGEAGLRAEVAEEDKGGDRTEENGDLEVEAADDAALVFMAAGGSSPFEPVTGLAVIECLSGSVDRTDEALKEPRAMRGRAIGGDFSP